MLNVVKLLFAVKPHQASFKNNIFDNISTHTPGMHARWTDWPDRVMPTTKINLCALMSFSTAASSSTTRGGVGLDLRGAGAPNAHSVSTRHNSQLTSAEQGRSGMRTWDRRFLLHQMDIFCRGLGAGACPSVVRWKSTCSNIGSNIMNWVQMLHEVCHYLRFMHIITASAGTWKLWGWLARHLWPRASGCTRTHWRESRMYWSSLHMPPLSWSSSWTSLSTTRMPLLWRTRAWACWRLGTPAARAASYWFQNRS